MRNLNGVRGGSIFLLTLAALFSFQTISAQEIAEAYSRYEQFESLTKGNLFNGAVSPQWIGKSSVFWYMSDTREGEKFFIVDPVNQDRREAFDLQRLEAAFTDVQNKMITLKGADLRNLEFTESTDEIRFVFDDFNWVCRLPSNMADGSSEQLSFDGGLGQYYSAERIRWSPDSKKVVTTLVRPAEPHMVHYIESSPESQLQPLHTAIEYYKPGDALPQYFPRIFALGAKGFVAQCDEMIPNQYSIGNPEWRPDSKRVTFEYNKRGHQLYQVIELDAEGTPPRVLIDEKAETFIDYSGKKFRYDVDNGREIIWASERDGWNHLYLYDGVSGKVKSQITSGEWVVRRVVNVDPDARTILFEASGREPGDPYFVHLYRISFNGSGLKHLTAGEGNHRTTLSPDRKFIVDAWSRVDMPSRSVVRDAATGKIIMELEEADISSLLATGWEMPEVFVSKGRDGVTDIWGMILKPSNFDPAKTYPVIEYIYAGPHGNHVPKDFTDYYNRCRHSLTELGFVIVMIDGMGTSNRSKAFQDVCWKNIGDAGFPDRILWIKDASSTRPWMDISKVGIYGKSAGGQNSTGALLFHPDFYKVGVSVCGCHDNRMDKIWWNEQWMGWPVGKEYGESSNVDNAYRLQGDLFLIVG
ncbi:MAG: S9 family peptidase, partial [Bacteroidales bacterium]|nr:S9 family peptidase [Bacteroidales bacterium]